MIEIAGQDAPPSVALATSGYLHPAYAESLAELGTPRSLRHSGGWLLERRIEGFAERDATGCYPLFCCQDWSQLGPDLDELGEEFVSVALVTDPFGDYDQAHLKGCFGDVVMPFKQHYVVDLSGPSDTFVSAHHRRNARRALGQVQVEVCDDPSAFLDNWVALYETLVKKHGIKGAAAFSRESFAKQLAVPGIVVLRAVHDAATVGALLWYVQGEIAYYHLGAYSERGYELRASFALFSHALEYFARRGVRWLSLGGGAGSAAGGTSGLNRFKEGWSTGTRTAWFCGRILDSKKYRELSQARGVSQTEFFPAYRVGEFS